MSNNIAVISCWSLNAKLSTVSILLDRCRRIIRRMTAEKREISRWDEWICGLAMSSHCPADCSGLVVMTLLFQPGKTVPILIAVVSIKATITYMLRSMVMQELVRSLLTPYQRHQDFVEHYYLECKSWTGNGQPSIKLILYHRRSSV